MTEAPTRRSLVSRWRFALATTNAPPGPIDPVTRWLVLTRAAVFPMTLTAGLVAGLLAWGEPGFNLLLWGLATAGIVLAHAANNLMNDLFDLEAGSDSKEYPRALYAPHPILSGMTTKTKLLVATGLINVADLGILAYLFSRRGWPMIAFAVGGFVLSAGYTAPPLRLKKRALGEPTVLAVWGPLMVGGTYYAAMGTVPWQVYLASIPYGLLCTAVLFGKHIDKLPWDAKLGIKTVPVLLGDAAARRVGQALMVGFYLAVAACVAVGALPWASLAVVGALPRLVPVLRAYGQPKPAEPPARARTIWPLWYAPIAFLHTRRAGALLLAGLVVGLFVR